MTVNINTSDFSKGTSTLAMRSNGPLHQVTLRDGSVHRCPVDALYLLKLFMFANQALSSTECGHKEVNSVFGVRRGNVLM
jgi:hypothetical protein